jgi:hypothetical protein
VLCGRDPCDLSTSFCCRRVASPPAYTCLANTQTVGACYGMGGDPFGCDESADCSPGQQCYVVTNSPVTTRCQATGFGPIMCKTDADCTGGKTCVTQTCNSLVGRGEVIKTCGGNPWCTGHP